MARPKQHVSTDHLDDGHVFTPSFAALDEVQTHLNVLLYGDPGTGKTRAAGTFPRPLVIDFESGYKTLQQLPAEQRDEIKVVHVDDVVRVNDDGRRVVERTALQVVWDYVKWLKNERPDDIDTLVIDSVTDLHKLMTQYVVATNPNRSREAPTIPSTEDYIQISANMKNLFRQLRDLPMHVVFTAHAKDKTSKGGAVLATFPAMSEALANDLAGVCDVVLYTEVVNEESAEGIVSAKYRGLTVQRDKIVTKDRSDKLSRPHCGLHFAVLAKAFGIEYEPPTAKGSSADEAASSDGVEHAVAEPPVDDVAPQDAVETAQPEQKARIPRVPTTTG